MKIFALLSCILAAALANSIPRVVDRSPDEKFADLGRDFDEEHNNPGRDLDRSPSRHGNLNALSEQDLKADVRPSPHRLRLDERTESSHKELRHKFLTLEKPLHVGVTKRFLRSNKTLPEAVDWRKEGYVTPVRREYDCGSCWTFSAAGSIEGQNFKKTGKLTPVSVQQLIDCATLEGNLGCGGGWIDRAYDSVIRMGGIMSESDYKYTRRDDPHTCVFNPKKVFCRLSGYELVDNNEDALQEAVATVGPISVYTDGFAILYHYYKGIYDGKQCQEGLLNHAVLVVGYGEENGEKFWIIKNSWGTSWGEDGYFRLRRGANLCGIAVFAYYPIIF